MKLCIRGLQPFPDAAGEREREDTRKFVDILFGRCLVPTAQDVVGGRALIGVGPRNAVPPRVHGASLSTSRLLSLLSRSSTFRYKRSVSFLRRVPSSWA